MSSLSIPNMLDVAARAHPERLALEFERERWSYAELQWAAARASEIIASAAAPGRLGILSANRPGFVTAIHAAARLGSTVVPLNWRQTPDEIVWQAREAGVSLLLFDESNAKTAEAVERSLVIPVLPVTDLENKGPERRVPPAPLIDLSRDAAIIYTSGTSGQAKGARITYGNFWHSAVASSLHLGHHADDVWLAVLSLFHIGGLSIVYRAAIEASGIVLHDRFDPERVLCAMDEGVTLVSLVPTMLQRLIDVRGETPWPSGLRCILLGGAPAPAELIDACLARGIPACPTYGLTESTAQVATMPPGRLSLKPASSGLPLPLTRVRIVEHGEEVKSGEIGEIEFSGPSRFAGYLGEPMRGGDDDWFGTGDAGYVDEAGYLYLVDRRTDLIVSGGENIYPAQIERVLLAHPAVRDAGVVGVPDRTWGARPVAFVVWDGEAADAEPILRTYCRAHLDGVRTPERVHVLPELPRNAAGKLLRRSLRATALSLYER